MNLGILGFARVAEKLGINRHTIRVGQKELVEVAKGGEISARIRAIGGGRKKTR